MVYHRFNRLQPSSAHPTLLPKPELVLDLTEESLVEACFQQKCNSRVLSL